MASALAPTAIGAQFRVLLLWHRCMAPLCYGVICSHSHFIVAIKNDKKKHLPTAGAGVEYAL